MKKKHLNLNTMGQNIDLKNINFDKLKTLKEDALRKNIIIPLLKYLELQNVTDMHGSNEEGIDVYFETKDIFGSTIRLGIQVKAVDIVYSSKATNRNILTILNQIQMAFSKKIMLNTSDRSGEVYIDVFYIITSGKINYGATKYFHENRNKCHYIQIIGGEMLMDIIKDRENLKQRQIVIPVGNPRIIFDNEPY